MSEARLLIRGGRVVDPSQELDAEMDVLINGDRIEAVGPNLEAKGAEVLEVKGLVVAPGFIDLHAHLRDPGQEWKEDIGSGSRAAAAGGYTTILCMPNTSPPLDEAARIAYVLRRAQDAAMVRVLPVGAISRGLEGQHLAEMGDMHCAGAVAFSDDGKPVSDAGLMRRALEYATAWDTFIIAHAEEPALVAHGVMHEGAVSGRLGLRGIPAAAEAVMVARDLMLAEMTGGRLHLAHLSTRESVRWLEQYRARGVAVTAEVTPHHLVLTDEEVARTGFDTNTKVNPPLRSPEHRECLRRALAEGIIDAVATDHAPHHPDDKDVEYDWAAFGVIGMETAFPVLYTHLVQAGILSLARLVEALTWGPARVLRRHLGSLRPGWPADVVVVDLKQERTVDPDAFYSKGRNCPFAGWELRGWPRYTISAGRLVFADGQIL